MTADLWNKKFGSALIKGVITWAWSKVSSRGCSILDIIWRSFIYQQRKGRESGLEGPMHYPQRRQRKGFGGRSNNWILNPSVSTLCWSWDREWPPWGFRSAQRISQARAQDIHSGQETRKSLFQAFLCPSYYCLPGQNDSAARWAVQ